MSLCFTTSLCLLSLFALSFANHFLQIDCLSITSAEGCSTYDAICEWDEPNASCQFLFSSSDILGAKSMDLVFILDHTIPDDLALFISSTVSKLYARYEYRDTLDFRCSIMPYQTELVSCQQLVDIDYISALVANHNNNRRYSALSLSNNLQSGIDILLNSNSNSNSNANSEAFSWRDRYVIPNLDNYDDDALKLCTKLKQLSRFHIYPLLVQWKAFESELDFELHCPLFQRQPQFLAKINKYDTNKSMPKIASIVASNIHRNSINCGYQLIDPQCTPFSLAGQAFGSRDNELWMVSGAIESPDFGGKSASSSYNNDEPKSRNKQSSSCTPRLGGSAVAAICFDMDTGESHASISRMADNRDQPQAQLLQLSTSHSNMNIPISDAFALYDISTGDASPLPSIPMQSSHGCVVNDGDDLLFHIGGYDSVIGDAVNTLYAFDQRTLQWIERGLPAMQYSRYLHACILVDSALYVFGGVSHRDEMNNVDAYMNTIEYLELNPMTDSELNLRALLCLSDDEQTTTDSCYIGGVLQSDQEPYWQIASTQIQFPRVSAKLFQMSENQLFLIGGYGYLQANKAQGSLSSIEIFNLLNHEIVCDASMGPQLVIPRASFSGAIYVDHTGYLCLHIIGGRTGVGDELSVLPMTNSCEQMCFPASSINTYMESMYAIFFEHGMLEVAGNDGRKVTSPFDIINRDKWTVWVVVVAIVIVFAILCVIVLVLKIYGNRKQSQRMNDASPMRFVDEYDPLLPLLARA